MSLDLIKRFPTLVYQSESFNLEIKLTEPGLIYFEIKGQLDLKAAQTTIEHLQDFQKIIAAQSQMAFLIVQINVNSKKSIPARAYLLRHLRWQASGCIYGVYCVTHLPLARNMLKLVGQLNPQTLFQIFDNLEQALAAVKTRKSDLAEETLAQLQQVWNEQKAYRFRQSRPRCEIRFYQPYDELAYVRLVGHLSLTALEAVMPTFKIVLEQLVEQTTGALVVDIRHMQGFDPKVLFVPTILPESQATKHVGYHFIANESQTTVIRILRFLQPSRYKNAQVFKHPQAVFRTLFPERFRQAEPVPLSVETEVEMATVNAVELPDLEALLQQQQEVIEKQHLTYLRQTEALKQALHHILNHQGNQNLKVQGREHNSPLNEVYELLEILHTDQVQMINDLQYQIDQRSHAQQEAQQANLVKSQFLATVSHELRTPLNAILGFTHVLKRAQQNFSADQQLYLAKIASNGEHLLQVVNQLLDLSRIESQKVRLVPEKLRLREWIQTQLEQTEVLVQNKDLEIQLEIPADLCLTTDAQSFKQILLNLLNNAIKYTAAGTIYLRALNRAEQHTWVLQIQDTGKGISTELQADIFEAFTSSDSPSGGVGLGLTIAHSAAQSLGYQLTLTESSPQGTTFEIELGPLE